MCQDFLTNRNQYVKIGNVTPTVVTTNTGAPHCPDSLFYTSDCKPIRENSNDNLLTNNDETAHGEKIGKLSTWCSANYLELKKKKTKEIIVDFRKKKQTPQPPPPPLVLQNENVERVTSYKYLGDWSKNIQLLVKKGQQRLYGNSKKLQNGQDNSTTFPPRACRNCTDIISIF